MQINNVQNIVYIYASQAVKLLSGLCILYFLTQNLSIESFGSFSLIKSALGVLGILVHLGIDNVITRYIPEMNSKGERNHSFKLMIEALKYRVISLLLVCTVVIFNIELIVNKFQLTKLNISYILCLLILTKLNTFFGSSFHTSVFKILVETKIQFFYDVVKLFGFVYLSIDNDISQIIILWILLESIILLAFFRNFIIFFKEELKTITKTTLQHHYKLRIIKYAKSQTIAVLLFIMVDVAVDNLMISYYYSNKEVALYSFSLGIVSYLSFINPSFILKNYLTSIFSKEFIGKINEEILNKIRALFKFSILVSIPFFTILALNVNEILMIIFNEKYMPAYQVIITGLFFYFFKNMTFTFSPLIDVFEKNKLFLLAGIFSLFNFILNLFLIPKFGIQGAIFGTGITWVIIFLIYLKGFYDFFKTFLFFPFTSLLYGIIFSLIFYYTNDKLIDIKVDNLISLGLKIISQLIIMFLLMYYLKIINRDDLSFLPNSLLKN